MRMRMKFKNPKYRELIKEFGFSDKAINCLLDSKNLTHEGARFADESVVLHFKPRCFEEAARYQPDKWNLYPEVVPPKEGEYLSTVKKGEKLITSSSYWGGDYWIGGYDGVVAFRALPDPYKPKDPYHNHPDEIAARKYRGEEE